ncbi:MAG: putative O-glycosylation ligase, exosortase A system-associated, partial [Rhodocyclaceae bacterium]|nr:putative O-glycosylation ligase, exosortase A system-associated [Rhodocyclaceae bacterium]
MRDLILFGIIFSLLPFCFFRPWMGILFFSWIGYMNPHRFTWSAAYDFPFAKIVAIVTVAGLFFTRDKQPLPKTRETILIILLGIYFTFTNFFAFYPDKAWTQWEKVIKILIMTLVTMVLVNDRKKLKYLIMVIAFSIGLLGIKGGIFSLFTGGEHRVYGPEGSFFWDSNDMALALNMTLPMLFYLAKDKENTQLMNKLLWIALIMCIISIIFTYSRGGFLTLAGVGMLLLLKTKHKVFAVLIAMVALTIAMAYIPEKWFERMDTIKNYEMDKSAMGRINAWHTAFNVAKDRPLIGGGFETFTPRVFDIYSPNPSAVHDVHSIYFEIIGEHGFVAFGLFIALIFCTLLTAQKLKWSVKTNENYKWAKNYANMFQISLIAYMIGGTFLGRAYFDLFYHIV